MKQTAVILVLAAVIFAPYAQAGSNENGGQPAAFRDMNVGGRASAMGGAFTAIADGGAGYLYNPAGWAQSRHYGVSFAYRAMKLDRRLGYFSIAIPAREQARLGFDWLHAGTSSLESRDEMGNIIPDEDFSSSENLVAVSFAKQFQPWLLIGGKLFYAQKNIADISAYTVGGDLGILFKVDMRSSFLASTFPLMQIGTVVENLGANYRWTTSDYWESRGRERGAAVTETFPTNFRAGVAFNQPEKYVLSADFEVNTATLVKTHIGGEYTYRRTLSIRAGLDNWHPTFGIGVFKKLSGFAAWVDFAYLTDKVEEGDDLLVSFEMVF